MHKDIITSMLIGAVTITVGSCASYPDESPVETEGASVSFIEHEAEGEFSTIGISKSMAVISAIQAHDATAIERVISAPDGYAPFVFYIVADALFEVGRKHESMFWFYAGQLRSRSDANKSLDPSARQIVSVLNGQYGERINKFAFSDIDALKKCMVEVVEWDKNTERNYDPRWIALHGLGAFGENEIRFLPRSQWEEINKKTRDDYLMGFQRVLEELKK